MALPLRILDSTSDKEYDSLTSSIPSSAPTSPADSLSGARKPLPLDISQARRSLLKARRSLDDSGSDDGGGEPDSPSPASMTGESLQGADYNGDEQVYVDVSSVPSYFPTHPLPEMQAPFEESMLDAGRKEATSNNYREANPTKFNGASRRSVILGQHGQFDNISYNAQWRVNNDASFHPIRKIMSQVIFGVHLLCQAMEQSIPEVATILRGFVQELDGFLRRVNADLDLSLKDVTELYGNLSLPLQHVNVFDQLLNDRNYRTQTLQGNIRIDGVIKRYSRLTSDYTTDLDTLRECNVMFGAYLARIGEGWTRGMTELVDINAAMCRNTAIWDANAKALMGKAEALSQLLENCAKCVFEFEKRCAAAARRGMSSSRASSRMSNTRSVSSRSSEKPLPAIPKNPELPLPTVTFAEPPPSKPATVPATPKRQQSSAQLHSRLARSAGVSTRSMQDLRSAGFIDSTVELADFLRSTAPQPPAEEPPTTTTNPPEPTTRTPRKLVKSQSRIRLTAFLTIRRRRPSLPPPGSAGNDDPNRPCTAPNNTTLSAKASAFTSPHSTHPPTTASSVKTRGERHIPLARLMQERAQTFPLSPLSSGSGTSDPNKPHVRFDSLVGSQRASGTSSRKSDGGCTNWMAGRVDGDVCGPVVGGPMPCAAQENTAVVATAQRSRLRLVLVNPFKL